MHAHTVSHMNVCGAFAFGSLSSSPSLPFSFLLLSRSSQRAVLLGGCAACFY
jgi:hypothetical protein